MITRDPTLFRAGHRPRGWIWLVASARRSTRGPSAADPSWQGDFLTGIGLTTLNVEVRYFDEAGGSSAFTFSVNGKSQGDPWRSSLGESGWKTHAIPGVEIGAGDEIAVSVQADAHDSGRLDYVQLNLR